MKSRHNRIAAGEQLVASIPSHSRSREVAY